MQGWTTLRLFSTEECADIRDRVFSVEEHWVRRSPVLPAFSLGAMSYEDAKGRGYLHYKLLSRRQNAILREHFGDVLETVRCVMEAYLEDLVEIPAWLAHPGFHIYRGGVRLAFNPASIHVDTPFADLDWPEPDALDVRGALSFTACIALPRAGGGLNVWDYRPSNPIGITRDVLAREISTRKMNYVPYDVGNMIIHDGMNAHQIAYLDAEPDDTRITLQGHAVRYGGVWQLYV